MAGNRRAGGGEELGARLREVVEDVGITFLDRLDDLLDLGHDGLGGHRGGGAAQHGDAVGDGLREPAQLFGSAAGALTCLFAAAGVLGGDVLGAGLGPGVGLGRFAGHVGSVWALPVVPSTV